MSLSDDAGGDAMICLTITQLNRLRPCSVDGRRVRAALKKLNADPNHCFTAAEAREACCTFDDIVWAASVIAINDKAVERRLRLWISDCAARVLHLYERDHPEDMRVRNAIKASRDYANGKITDAARDAATSAASAASDAASYVASWAARAAADAASYVARAARAARAAARDAAWAAEEQWQFDRLILWLGDSEPTPLRLPARPKKERLAA